MALLLKENKGKHDHHIGSINRVIDYIDQNIDMPLTLEELASQAHFSKFHFLRVFTDVVGESPIQYMLRMRLEKAAALIMTAPDLPISDIALQFGFADHTTFSRQFRKYFNQTPTAFRAARLEKKNHQQIFGDDRLS